MPPTPHFRLTCVAPVQGERESPRDTGHCGEGVSLTSRVEARVPLGTLLHAHGSPSWETTRAENHLPAPPPHRAARLRGLTSPCPPLPRNRPPGHLHPARGRQDCARTDLTEGETRTVCTQRKGHLQARKSVPSENRSCQHLDPGLPASRAMRQGTSVVHAAWSRMAA